MTGINKSKAQGDAELHNNKYDSVTESCRNMISFQSQHVFVIPAERKRQPINS